MTDTTVLIEALQKIAYGRVDNGRALGGPTSMSIARQALSRVGIDWSTAALRIKQAYALTPAERGDVR